MTPSYSSPNLPAGDGALRPSAAAAAASGAAPAAAQPSRAPAAARASSGSSSSNRSAAPFKSFHRSTISLFSKLKPARCYNGGSGRHHQQVSFADGETIQPKSMMEEEKEGKNARNKSANKLRAFFAKL